jgi:hypothetical protein
MFNTRKPKGARKGVGHKDETPGSKTLPSPGNTPKVEQLKPPPLFSAPPSKEATAPASSHKAKAENPPMEKFVPKEEHMVNRKTW